MSDIQVTGAQDFGQVTFRQDGHLGIVTLNRPRC